LRPDSEQIEQLGPTLPSSAASVWPTATTDEGTAASRDADDAVALSQMQSTGNLADSFIEESSGSQVSQQ
jgi:hypothetical protein